MFRYLAVYAAPAVGFVALGPMWRHVVAPATHFVVGTYLCTSAECLSVDFASTTSILSWGCKLFITVFGLFGAYLVRRWSWFQSHYEEEEDEFQRLERVEHKPWSQLLLSQLIHTVGLAFVYHATSANAFLSVLICAVVYFRSFLQHQWFLWRVFVQSLPCCRGPNFIRRQR